MYRTKVLLPLGGITPCIIDPQRGGALGREKPIIIKSNRIQTWIKFVLKILRQNMLCLLLSLINLENIIIISEWKNIQISLYQSTDKIKGYMTLI